MTHNIITLDVKNSFMHWSKLEVFKWNLGYESLTVRSKEPSYWESVEEI